jgi:hypothetical protein
VDSSIEKDPAQLQPFSTEVSILPQSELSATLAPHYGTTLAPLISVPEIHSLETQWLGSESAIVPAIPALDRGFYSDGEYLQSSFVRQLADEAGTIAPIYVTFTGNESSYVESLTPLEYERLQTTAVSLWQGLLGNDRQLDVDFRMADLGNGEIAAAEVTKFTATGLPTGGTVYIDPTAGGIGWFVDATPLQWEEFSISGDGSFLAKPESAAAGKYDLFTTLLHELGHIVGIGSEGSGFAAASLPLAGDLKHIDAALFPHDLMAASLGVGERRLPSALDVAVANLHDDGSMGYIRPYRASLLGNKPLANADFEIADPTDAGYGWKTSGSATIAAGVATLTDAAKELASLSQMLTIPANARQLQFTLRDATLGSADNGEGDDGVASRYGEGVE